MSETDQDAVYRRPGDGELPTHMHVILDGAGDFVVRAGGNRDLVAWDRGPAKKYDREKQGFIFANFLAYNAARREGLYEGTFDGPGGWLDVADTVSPLVLADPEEAAAAEVRPTRTAAPPA